MEIVNFPIRWNPCGTKASKSNQNSIYRERLIVDAGYKNEIIEVKYNKKMRIFGFIATVGSFIVFAAIFLNAIKFDSAYSILGVTGSLIGMLFNFYGFLHISPGLFKKGRVLFTIHPGPEGKIQSSKKSVAIRNIKDLKVERYGYTIRSLFFTDLVIYTLNDKKVRIPTYNLLDVEQFNQEVRAYILPNMTPEAQEHWNRKLNG
ncbi:hypothetical protein GKZ89_14210 [Bacillus mangrovi]|uniref:Uncharacterized protein n=1 Tax=Metabacillus mangrovi TaxID=1491830 RepID=A0A7X2V5U5_9BACI|nr:DUF5381 family protein [Metabacillus mangrovi]MTH54554.1 hypothetical protein [Metabacillus mangrovi]